MENIYKPSEFFCTQPLNLKEHFTDFSKLVLETDIRANNLKDSVAHVLGDIKRDSLKELEKACSVDKLNCPKEMPPVEQPDTILCQHKLTFTSPVTASSKEKLKTIEVREKFKDQPKLYAKYRHEIRHEFETNIMKREKSSVPCTLKPNRDVLYTIRIYQPFFFKYARKNYYKHCKYSHEIVALSSNTLAEVRDKILCRSDIGICQETEIPTSEAQSSSGVSAILQKHLLEETYPSNFIFIENVFYNDFRHPNAIDYSKVVLDWAQKWKVGKFKTGDSNKVKLCELNVRLGYPYVYQHQADCEHIFVFSDVRLLNSSDFLSKKDYPFYKSIARYNSQLCMICGLGASRWICTGSSRLPFDNTFLCQECCLSYNYIDGKKVDDVKIYPYFDKATVL